jgi:hypothetical protein
MFARKTSNAGFFVNSLGIRSAIASGMMQRWFSKSPTPPNRSSSPVAVPPPSHQALPYT